MELQVDNTQTTIFTALGISEKRAAYLDDKIIDLIKDTEKTPCGYMEELLKESKNNNESAFICFSIGFLIATIKLNK
jgi:pilus assembly protein TadC